MCRQLTPNTERGRPDKGVAVQIKYTVVSCHGKQQSFVSEQQFSRGSKVLLIQEAPLSKGGNPLRAASFSLMAFLK